MERKYSVGSARKKKNHDDKVVTFCISVIFIVVIMTYMYCGSMRYDERNMPAETESFDEGTTSGPVKTQVMETDSSIGSMAQAGNIVADMQNELIRQNNEYLMTVKNSAAAGYYGQILMTDEYKNLIEQFNSRYMKDNPSNAPGVLWSEYGIWEFNANYDYSAENNASMKAVWLCYDENDTERLHPYAVCTATYVTASDTFINPVLSRTEWYPRNSWISDDAYAAGMPGDPTVSADQCGDEDAANGSNDDGTMTKEQEQVRDQLQQMIDANSAKENAVLISH